jgi:hypothetical protein
MDEPHISSPENENVRGKKVHIQSKEAGAVPTCIRRRDSQDDRVGIGDVGQAHLANLSLDIHRLVPD